MGYRKIPWEQIKADYTLGMVKDGKRVYPTWDDIIAKYGIARSTLFLHVKNEDWNTIRKNNQTQIELKSSQKAIEKISDDLARVNTDGLEGALEIMRLARASLHGYLQAYKEMQHREDKAEAMQKLGSALRSLQQAHKGGLEAARLVLGEPTEITQEYRTMEQIFREYADFIDAEVEKSLSEGSEEGL